MMNEFPKDVFPNHNGIKILYKDEDKLSEFFCDVIAECSGEQPNESDPSGCTGCDANEEWVEEHYADHVLDESTAKEFITLDDHKEAMQKVKDAIEKHFVCGFSGPDMHSPNCRKCKLKKELGIDK